MKPNSGLLFPVKINFNSQRDVFEYIYEMIGFEDCGSVVIVCFFQLCFCDRLCIFREL